MIPVRATLAALLVLLASPRAAGSGAAATGEVRPLLVATSTGRSGVYYLPGERSRPLPLLVMLHGTGGTGSLVMRRVRAPAERERFIVLAPDSTGVAGTWLIRPTAAGPTEDHRHVVASVREVLAVPEVRVDRGRVLIAGFSVGGGAAAHLASHEEIFTALAVLHGHVVLDALGPRRVRTWLSTGDHDRARPAAQVRSLAEALTRQAGFREVEVRVFPTDHALGDDELAALLAWWLRPRGA